MRLLSTRMLKSATFEIGVLILVVAGAVALRVSGLDAVPFWVDEAESSINALTILQHGYPTDSYLGLPIFENTLIQPWPGNPEYEFRDVSYSERGVAVYHGWLPLYAIAASFAISGVKPDHVDPVPSVKHDLKERKRLTTAARMPAVLFAAAFLIVVFVGARMMYGRDAAWTALILGSIHPYAIGQSRQARYYSAQLLWTTACCVLVWAMVRRGRWRHFILAGVAFVLLFHTHLLSFVTAAMVVALATPLILKAHKQALAKMAVFGTIVAAGTLPWLILTGFLTHQGRIPRAWPMLRLPSDLIAFPPFQPVSMVLGAIFAAAVAGALLSGPRVRSRARKPLTEAAPSLALVAAWTACGYAAFLTLMPAASFATSRMNLSYWGPALIGASVICAAMARMLGTRTPTLAAPAIGLVLFALTGHSFPSAHPNNEWVKNTQVIDQLGAMRLNQDTKFFAAPNSHLIWTVYTGLPVQSIAPVRRQFLNGYRGDIVYIDSPDWDILSPQEVEEAALREGRRLTPESAEQCLLLLRTRQYREAMLHDVSVDGRVQLEPLPRFGETLLNASRQRSREVFAESTMRLFTRGFRIDNWVDWRSVFMYRFVNPDSRRGVKSNYSERLRGSEAVILADSGKVIYRSPWQPAPPRGSIQFRFIPAISSTACQ